MAETNPSGFQVKTRASWANRQVVLDPAGEAKPAPKAAKPRLSPKEAVPSIELPDYIRKNKSMAKGFQRVLDYVQEHRKAGMDEDDFREQVTRFVEKYPERVRQVNKDYWAGMRVALGAWRGQTGSGW